MSHIPSFLVALMVLVAGACASVLARSQRLAITVALSCQVVACGLVAVNCLPRLWGAPALLVVWDWPPPVHQISFRVDALSAFFLVWSLPLTLLGTLYAIGYLRPHLERGRHAGPHFALLNMTAASFVLVYTVQNALVFLLGWEIAAVSAWLLVIWDYRSQKVRFAGFNYLVSTHIGLFVLVAAFMLLHARTDSMDFRAFAAFLSIPGEQRVGVFVLLGLAFALKSAFYPFHTWLPRAHAAAPAHVSALMSGVIHKAGLFGFLRFSLLLGKPDEWMGWSVLCFGAMSALFGVLHTVPARDLKRLLGYSSTENVGIAAMGFGLGYLGWTWGVPQLACLGFAAGLMHILNHALFKCLLFYAAGSVYHATHTVDIERMGGLARSMPHTTVLFLSGSLAIAALPPLNGFWSELALYQALFSGAASSSGVPGALVALAAILAFTGAVSAFAVTRAFGITFLGRTRDATLHVAGDPPRTMLGAMWTIAIFMIAIGWAPELGLALCRPVLSLLPQSLQMDRFSPFSGALSPTRALTCLLLVAALFTHLRGRYARRSVTWGCGYTHATARMQYTGSSFAQPLVRLFESVLPVLRRTRITTDFFPRHADHLATHTPDAVENRLFEVLGRGEDLIRRISHAIPEQPRLAFAAGLLVLLLLGVIVFGGAGR